VTDDEAIGVLHSALEQAGLTVDRVSVSPLPGAHGLQLLAGRGGPEGGGSAYYVETSTGRVYQMPSATPTADMFETLIPADRRASYEITDRPPGDGR
jgi:hypothetical protein